MEVGNKPSTTTTKQSKDRASNFSAVEDIMCTKAYFCASEDPICGAKQKGKVFKAKIEAAFNQLKEAMHEEEKREAQRPSYLQANGGFLSVLKQNEFPKSGEDIGAWRRRVLSLYNEKYGSEFKYWLCNEISKDKPKFMALFGVQDQSKNIAGGQAAATTTPSLSGSGDEDDLTATPKNKRAAPNSNCVGSKATRPVGMKKAKKIKQQDKMADRMAKRFGLTTNAPNHNANDTLNGSHNLTTTTNSASLHDVLAQFLSVAGNSMSTWMLQFMSTPASEDLCCAYAIECIREKILQMKAKNDKLARDVEYNEKTQGQTTTRQH